MRIHKDAQRALKLGIDSIVEQFQLPRSFSPEIESEAARASSGFQLQDGNRRDLTGLPFVTLDPATSTDLDQAFYLEEDGESIVLYYALADIGAFAPHHGLIAQEAWKRGVTIYGIEGKIPLYPKSLSQRAASLLPEGPRPAILVTVSIAKDGTLHLQGVESIYCSSRAKLAYDAIDIRNYPLLQAFAERMWLNDLSRGAMRIDSPQQEVIADETAPGGVRLELRSRLYSEVVNSALSLAVNIALGELLRNAEVGLFRTMDTPNENAIRQLRRSAHAFGIEWDLAESLYDLQRRLDPNNTSHQRFLLETRRSGGRASYEIFSSKKKPWHSAIAATYVHATAPMRRLADRYVLDLALLIANRKTVPESLIEVISLLPESMQRSENRANGVDRAVIDLIEAVSLQHRIGEVLDAEVVDADAGIVQTQQGAIRARASNLPLCNHGDKVKVRIEEANPAKRRVRFVGVF
ncbi:MAG: RNB domain-containing ribonuclease [Pirellula sp.]|jgi:exoribonuclease R